MVPNMTSAVVPEEVLALEPALPSQFHDIWSRSRYVSPERALVLAVLEQALGDLEKYRYATRRRQQRLYMEAYKWVTSDDREWPYSFVNLCEALSMSPESVREQLLGNHTFQRRRTTLIDGCVIVEEAA
jgi:hypothetical protein